MGFKVEIILTCKKITDYLLCELVNAVEAGVEVGEELGSLCYGLGIG